MHWHTFKVGIDRHLHAHIKMSHSFRLNDGPSMPEIVHLLFLISCDGYSITMEI
jgi:hypothetical protein